MGGVYHGNIWLYCQNPRFPSSISLCKCHLKMVFNVVAGWCIECVCIHIICIFYRGHVQWCDPGVCLERACHCMFFKLREQHLLEVNTAGEDSWWSESEPPSTVHINIFSQLCTASACISMTLHSTRRGSSFLLTVTELQDSLPNSWQLIALTAPHMHSKFVAKGPHISAATGADELREKLTWLCACRCCPT